MFRNALAAFVIALTILSYPTLAFEQPQYICWNKMYGCTTQPGCWDEDIPESISQASIDLFLAALSGQRGSEKRRLCLGYQFNVLSGPLAPKLNALDNILALSEANNLPVVLTIDPFEFWDGMPQLWNFWNSSHPGYDPNNVMNVEWTGPSPANATSVSWANWGAQFRKAPCPNLSSVAFRAAAAEAMRPFLSRIADFDASLALQRKQWLLAGVKCSWEASIGVNYFEYPNPNSFTNLDPAYDPQTGISESVQIGYAAVCTGSNECPISGEITQSQLDLALNSYLEFVAGLVASAGIPRHKILTHAGSFFGDPPTKSVLFNSPAPSVTMKAKAGWSFYTYAFDPRTASGLSETLDLIEGAPWAATEWRYMGGLNSSLPPEQQWYDAFNNTISLRNCRLIDVYNIENVPEEALAASQQILAEVPTCLVDSAANLSSVRLNTTHSRLSWVPGSDTMTQRLSVSANADTDLSGNLLVPNILSQMLSGVDSLYDLLLSELPAYWTIVSSGCDNTQIAVAAVMAVVI